MNNNITELAAKSYFFAAVSQMTPQNTAQAFGPVVGAESNQYRLSSIFNTSAALKAYAVCTGQVFLQPHVDNTKINLILRPYRQPMRGVPIKYFVYRGLRKTDFIPSGNTVLVPHSALGMASEFMQTIWNQLKNYNGWTNAEADGQDFLARWIGYDPTNQSSTTLIDDYFFAADAYDDNNAETLKPYELTIIAAGTHLGDFIGDYALDVVLSNGDYKEGKSNTGFTLDLAYARAAESILDIAQLPSGYAEKQYREAVTMFMDATAYYGLHVTGGKVMVQQGADTVTKKEQSIYDDLLTVFANKNRVYVHIQGHLGRSYDYYRAYSDRLGNNAVLKMGTSAATLEVVPYPEHQWPVIMVDTPQKQDTPYNQLVLQLVYDTEGTVIARAQTGRFSDEAENNFLTAANLLPEVTIGEDGTPLDNYTNPITLWVPAVAVSGNRPSICTYVKLLYQGVDLTVADTKDGEPVAELVKPIDTLFGPVDAKQRLASVSKEVISWSTLQQPQLLNTRTIDVDGPENHLAVQQRKVANKLAYGPDNKTVLNTVIYETFLLQGIGEGLPVNSTPNTATTEANSFPFVPKDNNSYTLAPPLFYSTTGFTDFDVTVNGLRLQSEGKEYPNKFVVGLTQKQYLALNALLEDLKLVNSRFFFKLILEEESPLISQQGVAYFKFQIGVLGENGQGLPEIHFPQNAIAVYTLDHLVFFSAPFSEHMENKRDGIAYENLTIQKTL
ncbi:MAG: hypothetical protein AAGF77_13855 [Bacteroidota bacterium]